jgi:hypothetical protein
MNIPFHLDQAISRWRAELNASGSIGSADLAELETHLRDSFGELRGHALADDEAFHVARRRLGGAEIAEEFAKVDPDAVWAERARWMIFGVLVSQIFWNGSKMVSNLAAITAAMSTSGLSWSGRAAAWSHCLTSLLVMGLLIWVLVRLVRGKWRLGNSRQVAFLLHPAVLAGMVCLLAFLNTLAMTFFVRTLGLGVYIDQTQILQYFGLAMLAAVPVILAAALTKAQRRAHQVS